MHTYRKGLTILLSRKKGWLTVEVARKFTDPNPDAVAAGTGPWPATEIVQPDAKLD